MCHSQPPPRRGFTIAEITIVLALLGALLTLVAQVGITSIVERQRASQRQAAQELAANLLESARALSWEDLTPEWAKSLKLPDSSEWQGWKLEVTIANEKERPNVKRMTVAVHWPAGKNRPPRPVELVGLFAARGTKTPGGKP